MGKFSKIKKYSKPSLDINEKIENLNRELSKVGMLSERMTTSTVYSDTETQPYIPPTYDLVPDSTGITGNSFTQPANGGDENDSDTWADGWNSNEYLTNADELDGVSNRSIVSHVPNSPYGDGGGGIVITGRYFGRSIGYLSGGNEYKQVLSGGLTGGTNVPTEDSRGLGGSYAGYTDDAFNYAVAFWNAYKALADEYGSNSIPTVNVKAWVRYNRFHDYQRGGEFADWTGGPKKTTDDGNFILDTFAVVKVRSTDKYMSDPGQPRTAVLNRMEDPDSAHYHPGFIERALFGALDVGRRGLEYLRGKATSSVQSLRQLDSQFENEFKKLGSRMDIEINSTLEYLKNSFQNLPGLLNMLVQLTKAAPPAAATLFTFGDINNPNSKNYGKYTPGHPNYQGPYTPPIPGFEQQHIAKTLSKAIETVNPKDVENLTEQERNLINTYMVGDFSNTKGTDAKAGQTYYNIFHNLPTVNSIKKNSDGSYTLRDNYRFTDRDGDVSFHPLQSYVESLAKNNPQGSEPFLDKPGGKEIGRLNNMEIELKLPPTERTSVKRGQGNQPLGKTAPRGGVKESFNLTEGWQSPKHTDIESDERKRWFNPSDVAPPYPTKPPNTGVYSPSGESEEPQRKREPHIKITKDDLLKNHRLKDSEVKEMMDTINSLNAFLDAHPEELIHARKRYPKNDPRLAELNWKMDQMLGASEEYLDGRFPENTRLFDKLQKSIKRNIQLTDPKTFKNVKSPVTVNQLFTVDYISKEGVPILKKKAKSKNKKSPARFLKKPRLKTKSEMVQEKLSQLQNDLKKFGMEA